MRHKFYTILNRLPFFVLQKLSLGSKKKFNHLKILNTFFKLNFQITKNQVFEHY